MSHVIIVGNGISGTTAARHIRKLSSKTKITMISNETRYPYSRTALMYIYMGHMLPKHIKLYEDFFYPKNRIDLVYGQVKHIEFGKKQLTLWDFDVKEEQLYHYDKLILATGSTTRFFNWPGQDLEGVQGLVKWQDLEKLEAYSPKINKAVVVGGGLIGIELAEMLLTRKKQVTMLIRENSYWGNVLPKEEGLMVEKIIEHHGITLEKNENMVEILGEHGHVKGVKTASGKVYDADFVGITTGVQPDINFTADRQLEINGGILVNSYLETSEQNVYAIGDCSEQRVPQEGRAPLEAVWYTGRMMGEVVACNVLGKEIIYNPGVWYNSAKFISLEYQVYGKVPINFDSDIISLFWSNEAGNKAIRICYKKEGEQVTGFNLMGIRLQHEVVDAWLREQKTMEEILADLRLAIFDPEFEVDFYPELLKEWQKQSGQTITPRTKRKGKVLHRFRTKLLAKKLSLT